MSSARDIPSNALVKAVEDINVRLVKQICRSRQNISSEIKTIALCTAITSFGVLHETHERIKLKKIYNILLDNGCTLSEVRDQWYHLLQLAVENRLRRITHHLLYTVKILRGNCDLARRIYKHKLIRKIKPVILKMALNTLRFDTTFDINAVDRKGRNALLMLMWDSRSMQGSINILKHFIRRGINIDHQSNNGKSAIFLACRCHDEKFVKILIKANANINIRTMNGLTPLHKAANNETICLMLLRAGADPNIIFGENLPLLPDYIPRTAIAYVSLLRHYRCLSLLLQYGADPYLVKSSYSTLIYQINYHDVDLNYDMVLNEDEYEYEEKGRCCTIILEDCIIKRIVADLHVKEDDLYYFENCLTGSRPFVINYAQCEANCTSELERMKILPTAEISYFEILTSKNPDRLVKRLRNEDFIFHLEQFDYKNELPIYGHLLHRRIQKAKKTAYLLNSSSHSLDILCGGRLPYLPLEHILSFLTDCDMETLIQSTSDM